MLYMAVKNVAWGYLFLHLHFNIGTLDLIPDWVGYLLILAALPVLAGEVRTASLLPPLAVGLAVWEGLKWLLNLFGGAPELPLLTLLATVIALYFHFQLLTDIAVVADLHGYPKAKRIRTLRTVQTVVITAFALPLGWESWEYGAIILMIVGLIATFWICAVLFSLSCWLKQNLPPDGQ